MRGWWVLLWAASFISSCVLHGWSYWVVCGIVGYSAYQMCLSDDYFDEDA